MIVARPALALKPQWVTFNYLSDKSMLQSMLEAYSLTMKKPTQATKAAELTLLSSVLAKSSSAVQTTIAVDYLSQLRNYKLFNIQSLNLIENWVQTNQQNLCPFDKLVTLCFLTEQGRYAAFNESWEALEENLRNWGEKQKQQLAQIIYSYCKCIVKRDITIIEQPSMQACLQSSLPQNQKWRDQIELSRKACHVLQASYKFSIGSCEQGRKLVKRRSNLQVEVEAILKAMGYTFQRQANIQGFAVDFLVDISSIATSREVRVNDKCILEVLGSHHYTVEDKLFGKDIFRILTLNRIFPTRMIHAVDLNHQKGVQKKMEYIDKTISNSVEGSSPNWEPYIRVEL